MLFIFIELYFLVEGANFPVDTDTGKSIFPRGAKPVFVLTLPPAHHRRHYLNLRPRLVRQQRLHDLIDRLGRYFFAALMTVWHADARKQQAEIIVNFGNSPHRGARIPVRCFLFDRYRGRKAVDKIDIRLFHHPQKLPRVRRKRLDVPPLSLGINGIKGKRGLSRPGKTGDNNQAIPRDIDRYVFKIVLSRPSNPYYRLAHICVTLTDPHMGQITSNSSSSSSTSFRLKITSSQR